MAPSHGAGQHVGTTDLVVVGPLGSVLKCMDRQGVHRVAVEAADLRPSSRSGRAMASTAFRGIVRCSVGRDEEMGDALSIERGQGLVEVRGEPMTGFLHVQRVWAGAALHMERTGARVDWRVTGSLGALEEGDRIDYEGAYFEVEAAGAWRPHHDVFCGDRLRSPPDPGTFHRSGSLSLDPEYRDASRRHRLVLQVIPRVRRRLVERYAVAAVVPPDSAGESPH